MPTVEQLYAFPSTDNRRRELDLVHEGRSSRFRLTQTTVSERKGKKFETLSTIDLDFGEVGQLVGFLEGFMPTLEARLGQ